jgi:hypothetical protein
VPSVLPPALGLRQGPGPDAAGDAPEPPGHCWAVAIGVGRHTPAGLWKAVTYAEANEGVLKNDLSFDTKRLVEPAAARVGVNPN